MKLMAEKLKKKELSIVLYFENISLLLATENQVKPECV